MSFIDRYTGARLSGEMPGIEPVTLQSRGPGETGFTAIPVPRARRKPVSLYTLQAGGLDASQTWLTWQIFDTGLSVTPKRGDAITDGANVTWQVDKVDGVLLKGVWNCLCCQNR